MKTRKLISLSAAGALAATAAGMGSAQAATKTAIDKAGARCFKVSGSEPAGTRVVFSLDIDPADHPTKQPLWWVSGVEKATNPDVQTERYVNNLNGTATLAKPNNGRPGKKLIHMSLSGTSFGSYTDVNATGLWQLDYNLQLNRKTLKGKIVGLSVFTPISGNTAGASQTLAINANVKPISCTKI